MRSNIWQGSFLMRFLNLDGPTAGKDARRCFARGGHDSKGKGSVLGNANLRMAPSKKKREDDHDCVNATPRSWSIHMWALAGWAGLPWPRELPAAQSSWDNTATLFPNPPSFPKTAAGPLHLNSIPFSNHCGPALPSSCPTSSLLEPQLLAPEPHCRASPPQSSTDPKIRGLRALTRASPALRGGPGRCTDYFPRPPGRILRKEGRQGRKPSLQPQS